MEIEHAARIADPDLETHESARLAMLRSYGILDTDRDVAFDRLVRTAAQTFRVPMAGIVFLDADRLWFKAQLGLERHCKVGGIGSCIHAILSKDVLIVEDTAQDARLGLGPVMPGRLFYRFYAGAPLIAPTGLRLGTLCVLDYQPYPATAKDVSLLVDMAHDVMRALERRRSRLRHRSACSLSCV